MKSSNKRCIYIFYKTIYKNPICILLVKPKGNNVVRCTQRNGAHIELLIPLFYFYNTIFINPSTGAPSTLHTHTCICIISISLKIKLFYYNINI